MKHISKREEPPGFTKWKGTIDTPWIPPQWDQMPRKIKDELKRELVNEQGFICCYCEKRISENICRSIEDDTCSHIEHIKPRSNPSYHEYIFDYNNLVSSCEGKRLLEQPSLHCGHFLNSWYDEKLFVSPLDPPCESLFVYTSLGEIRPAGNSAASEETIRRLGLNNKKLKKLRESVIEVVIQTEMQRSDPSSPDERELRRQRYSGRDESGKFQPFYSAIMQVLSIYQLI